MEGFSNTNNERVYQPSEDQNPNKNIMLPPQPENPSRTKGNFIQNPNINKEFYSSTPVPEDGNPFIKTQNPDYISSNQVRKVYCGKHRDKEIEYYCKLCHSIVCPKCMFLDHNGHELAQLEDVASIIKQNIHDLNKLLMNTKRINEDKRNYIVYLKKETDRLKEVQLKNIDQGFGALIKRMEDKRDSLKEKFQAKYVAESMNMYNKITHIDKFNNDISNIEIVYEELYKFVNKNIDAKVCAKINDISSFISKSIEDLEKIARARGFDKSEAFIKPDLKPLTLNVDKAYEIIGKFNLISSKSEKKGLNQEQKIVDNPVRNRQEMYQPSPIESQNNRNFIKNTGASSSSNNVERMIKGEYDNYEKSSLKNLNFSTKGRRGEFDSQVQIMPEEYTSYDRSPYEEYQEQKSFAEESQNIALKSLPNNFEGGISKNSFNHPEFSDGRKDLKDVERIQQELIQMDIREKQ